MLFVGLSGCCSAASFAACFCLRFCFFRLTGAAPFVPGVGAGICPFDLMVVWAMAGDVSEDSVLLDLGTVMNFEPSLFVYFAVAFEVGDVGDCTVWCRWFAGIPIRCAVDQRAWKGGNCSRSKGKKLRKKFFAQQGGVYEDMLPETHTRCQRNIQCIAPPRCMFCRLKLVGTARFRKLCSVRCDGR